MADTRFKPGNPGGPGRKPGSRNKLNEDFLRDLQELWTAKGADILRRTAQESPETIVKVQASLLPKQVEVSRPLGEMSDDDLAAALEYLRASLAEGAAGGMGSAPVAQPAEGLPTLQ